MNHNKKKSPKPKIVKPKIKVVVQTPKPKQKRKSTPKKMRTMTQPRVLMRDFLAALTNPFAPNVLGCRVPDPWSFPTETYHLTSNTVVSTGTFTAGTLLFLPNPLFSMIDLSGLYNNSGGSIQDTGLARMYVNTTQMGYWLYGATNTANLLTIMSTFRVVSWGIKISNLQPEMTATGRIIIGYLPCTDEVPNLNFLTAGGQSGGSTSCAALTAGVVGLPYVDSSSLLGMPTTQELAVQDLLHEDIMISGKVVNPIFYSFKGSRSSLTYPNIVEADDVIINSTTNLAQTSSGMKDPTRCDGGCAIFVRWEGMPASATPLNIEVIYHLEGTPQVSTTTSQATPVASTRPNDMCVGTSSIVEAAMAATADESTTMTWIDKGLTFLHDNRKSIAGGVAKIESLAGLAATFL